MLAKKMGWEPDEGPRRLRRLPALLGGALGLLWEAAPRLIVLMAVLQVISAGATAFSLLVVRDVVSKVLEADRTHVGFGPVVPELALLALVLGLTGLAFSVQNSIRMLCIPSVRETVVEVPLRFMVPLSSSTANRSSMRTRPPSLTKNVNPYFPVVGARR